MFTVIGMRKLHRWTHSSLTLVLDHIATIRDGDYAKEIVSMCRILGHPAPDTDLNQFE